MRLHENVTLDEDVLFVNKIPFLLTVAGSLRNKNYVVTVITCLTFNDIHPRSLFVGEITRITHLKDTFQLGPVFLG